MHPPLFHVHSAISNVRSQAVDLLHSHSVRLDCNFVFHTFSCFASEATAARMGRFQNESVAEQIYRAFTRKNSVYVSVIMIGAVIGEKMVVDFVEGCWQSSNQGKFYEDIPNLGSLAEGEE